MELKRIEKQEIKNYAKKNEITQREMKNATPIKWLSASAMGLATLMYTGKANGINRVGIVFGCVELEEIVFNHTPLWIMLDKVHTVIYYTFLISIYYLIFSGIFVVLRSIAKKIMKKENKENEKREKLLVLTWVVSLSIILLFMVFSEFLKLDLSIFFEGGVKQAEFIGLL